MKQLQSGRIRLKTSHIAWTLFYIVLVNHYLSSNMARKYLELLQKHSLEPEPHQIVVAKTNAKQTVKKEPGGGTSSIEAHLPRGRSEPQTVGRSERPAGAFRNEPMQYELWSKKAPEIHSSESPVGAFWNESISDNNLSNNEAPEIQNSESPAITLRKYPEPDHGHPHSSNKAPEIQGSESPVITLRKQPEPDPDSALSLSSKATAVAPSDNKSPMFEIIVLAMDRHRSLKRLLDSLEAANYDQDKVQLTIQIDHSDDNGSTQALARAFAFSHGPKRVQVATKRQGLRSAWLSAWTAPRTWQCTCDTTNLNTTSNGGSQSQCGHAIILEDDIQVSPAWYTYLKEAWALYDCNSATQNHFAGIALSRQTLVPDNRIKPPRRRPIVNNHQPFLFKIVGSWGFSPHPKVWADFLAFVESHAHDLDTFDFYVPHLINNDWYNYYERNSIWTQLFIYFCEQHDLYNLYIHLPERQTLAAHWRQQGEHYTKTLGRDFDLYPHGNLPISFPSKPIRYGYDGQVETIE